MRKISNKWKTIASLVALPTLTIAVASPILVSCSNEQSNPSGPSSSINNQDDTNLWPSKEIIDNNLICKNPGDLLQFLTPNDLHNYYAVSYNFVKAYCLTEYIQLKSFKIIVEANKITEITEGNYKYSRSNFPPEFGTINKGDHVLMKRQVVWTKDSWNQKITQNCNFWTELGAFKDESLNSWPQIIYENNDDFKTSFSLHFIEKPRWTIELLKGSSNNSLNLSNNFDKISSSEHKQKFLSNFYIYKNGVIYQFHDHYESINGIVQHVPYFYVSLFDVNKTKVEIPKFIKIGDYNFAFAHLEESDDGILIDDNIKQLTNIKQLVFPSTMQMGVINLKRFPNLEYIECPKNVRWDELQAANIKPVDIGIRDGVEYVRYNLK